jgi:hypothetical protein
MDSIKLLEAAGYNVGGIKGYVSDEEMRKQGIVEVWQCRDYNKKPENHSRVEMFVPAIGVSCKCQKQCTRVWPK